MLHLVASLILVSSTLGDVDVSDLSRGASWIGRVKIKTVESLNSGSVPTTLVSAEIVEALKGSGAKGSRIDFQAPGGSRGQKRFMVLGVPSFRVDRDYILFLTKDPSSASAASPAELLGWSAFQVIEDSRGVHVIRAGDTTIVESQGAGYHLTHDRSFKDYDVFVAEVFRSLD